MRTNYSRTTSLPSYQENQTGKEIQKEILLGIVTSKSQTTLKELEEIMTLPQSTISGRVNDLIREKKVMYSGTTMYKKRTRKVIVLYVAESTQTKLFN